MPARLLAATAAVEDDLPLSGIGHASYLVSDLAKADAFYRDTLGFERAFELKNAEGQINLVASRAAAQSRRVSGMRMRTTLTEKQRR